MSSLDIVCTLTRHHLKSSSPFKLFSSLFFSPNSWWHGPCSHVGISSLLPLSLDTHGRIRVAKCLGLRLPHFSNNQPLIIIPIELLLLFLYLIIIPGFANATLFPWLHTSDPLSVAPDFKQELGSCLKYSSVRQPRDCVALEGCTPTYQIESFGGICPHSLKLQIFPFFNICEHSLIALMTTQSIGRVRVVFSHTSYLSFFVHGQDLSSQNFTPKSA